MKKIVIILAVVFVGMEGLGWLVYKNFQKKNIPVANVSVQSATPSQKTAPEQVISRDDKDVAQQRDNLNSDDIVLSDAIGSADASSFPPPSVEMVDGITQRTIHMGVRQWEWDPSQISVNYGEKVILIMHNADVPHSIMIPDLNVNAAIPADGAVVTFVAGKRGTFNFFCAVPCGNGHSKMQGKITVV